MILGAKGIDMFFEALGNEMNNEAAGKTILVVMGMEMVFEVLCFEWVDIEVVILEFDGKKTFKEGDLVCFDVVGNEARMRDDLLEGHL